MVYCPIMGNQRTPNVRLTPRVQTLLAVFASEPDTPQYGLEMTKKAGFAHGAIYPILARLELAGWVESDWEQIDESREGRRRRRYYQLTPEGRKKAVAALADAQKQLQALAGLLEAAT